MPPNLNVNVLYKKGSITYPGSNGGNVEVRERDTTITFVRLPGSDSFSFTVRNIILPSASDFTQSLPGDGTLKITDSRADAGTYTYTLVVTDGEQEVRSDPQIVNKL
jgi:hypothetical protein